MKKLIKLTYYSISLLFLSPIMMNSKPLVVFNTHAILSPILYDYTELDFGGDSELFMSYSENYQSLLKDYVVISPLYPHSSSEYGKPLCKPSWLHPLGTNLAGQDNLAYLTYGTCSSIITASLLTSLSVVVGTVMGLLASLYPGKPRAMVQYTMEIIRSIPLALVIILTQGKAWLFIIVFAATQWSHYGQVIRQHAIELLSKSYVTDARLCGMRTLNIAKIHILPHIKLRWGKQIPYTFLSYWATLEGLAYFSIELINKPSIGGLIRSNQQHPDAILITIICCGLFKLVANFVCD